jgi:hypothetical protein
LSKQCNKQTNKQKNTTTIKQCSSKTKDDPGTTSGSSPWNCEKDVRKQAASIFTKGEGWTLEIWKGNLDY